MQATASKEKILKKARKALINKSTDFRRNTDFEKKIYIESEEPLDIKFAQEFTNVSGKFIYCENENEFIDNLGYLIKENKWQKLFCIDSTIKELLQKGEISYSDIISNADFANAGKNFQEDELIAGITTCEFLIARTGSIMISSKQTSGRRLAIFPDVHLVLAYRHQLVKDIKNALQNISDKYESHIPSMISIITGPSRTADIEKTLILGAHGPKDVYVFLIDGIT